jgi:DNA (cytosine-5)-methyltransferase 1
MGAKNPLNCVSLFSGCGGLDLGLSHAGFKTVFAVDNEPRCAESFQANFSDVPFYCGSITDVNSSLIKEVTGLKKLPSIDLLAGGPPCPPFSKSRFYRKEKPRALNDPLGMETIEGYLNLLAELKPRAFILENVHGLAYKVHDNALGFITDFAEKEKYHWSWRILNAADYGVPQIRERLFIVGVKDGSFEFPHPTHTSPDARNLLNNGLPNWVTAGEAIRDLDTEANADDKGHFAGGKYHHLLKEIPPGDNYLFFTEKRGHPNPVFEWRSRYWSFLLKLSPDMPSWTIQARRSNNMGPLHWRNRILRIEEVKRLQTFPDDWYLAGTIEKQWRQIGNAVPPRLAQHLGEALYSHLTGNKEIHATLRDTQASGGKRILARTNQSA